MKLDKLNRKQLKTIELSGNKIGKEYFSRVGVPLVGGVYDYSNEKVNKYKNDLANKVKESFGGGFDNLPKFEEKVIKSEIKSNQKVIEEIAEKKEETSDIIIIIRGSFEI